MKYELTTNTKIFNGITLYQIRACINFSVIKKGDLGGRIEKESNLSQGGDAWVGGDARVEGNARVRGGCKKTPINIIGLDWSITIIDDHIHIGCEYHTTDDWCDFDDEKIAQMNMYALAFWKKHKTPIISLAKLHQGEA